MDPICRMPCLPEEEMCRACAAAFWAPESETPVARRPAQRLRIVYVDGGAMVVVGGERSAAA